MNRTYIQHYKSLFTLGIPIVIGQVGVIILGFADTLMIGHHSTNELAAASFVNNMFTLAIILHISDASCINRFFCCGRNNPHVADHSGIVYSVFRAKNCNSSLGNSPFVGSFSRRHKFHNDTSMCI